MFASAALVKDLPGPFKLLRQLFVLNLSFHPLIRPPQLLALCTFEFSGFFVLDKAVVVRIQFMRDVIAIGVPTVDNKVSA